MNNFIEFCNKNGIQFSICDDGYYDDKPNVIEFVLFKYHSRVEKRIRLDELGDEGLKFEEVCLDFARDFNDFCEKVGE